jgi:flagellar hook-length control protein FliK
LTKAKSRPSRPAAAQSQPSNAAATSIAKKSQTKSVQLKDKSNPQQQKQQNAKSNPSDGGDAESQSPVQVSEPAADQEANVAEQNSPAPVVVELRSVVLLQATEPMARIQDAKPNPNKATAQKSDQSSPPSQTSPPSTTLASAAPAQQAPAATATATAQDSASNDDCTDPTTLKQPAGATVRTFKPSDSTAEASAAQDDVSTDAPSTPAADADGQLPTKGKAAGVESAAAAVAEPLPGFSTAQVTATGAQPTPAVVVAAAASSVGQSAVAQFAQANQPSIVSAIHGKLLPNGGTMSISLNPPDLGAMQITVRMEDGVMSATFQTSNDQATRLLTHTLGQLKEALEMQGVSVDRLHVQQSSDLQNSSGKEGDSESGGRQSTDGGSAQQEQQRREALRRMWRRIRGDNDPLDLVA